MGRGQWAVGNGEEEGEEKPPPSAWPTPPPEAQAEEGDWIDSSFCVLICMGVFSQIGLAAQGRSLVARGFCARGW